MPCVRSDATYSRALMIHGASTQHIVLIGLLGNNANQSHGPLIRETLSSEIKARKFKADYFFPVIRELADL